MNESPADEIVDLGGDQWIALSYSRRWPKYVVNWSIRRRVGDADFPLAGEELEALPVSGVAADEIWAELRQRAVDAAGKHEPETPTVVRRSLISRLFGRG